MRFRFPDTGTRIAWQEALANAVQHHKNVSNPLAAARRAWIAKAVDSDSASKGRGVLASALPDTNSSEEGAKPPATPVKRGTFGSFTEGGGASHLHRLLRLRTERALAPFVGGAGAVSAPRGLNRAATAPAAGAGAQQRPPEVKVIINQRGSPAQPIRKQPSSFK